MARTLRPIRFRFAEQDRTKYGDQWWTFDEQDLTRLRARELMAIDDELRSLKLNTQTLLTSFARAETRGALGVMWLARRLAGVTEPLDGFDPLPMLAEVQVLDDGGDDDADPPAEPSSSSPVSAEG